MAVTAFAVALALVGLVVTRRRGRARALAAVRASWGMPVERSRQLEAIAAGHRSRVLHTASVAALDDRTWEDLNLDQVFVALDRTESTLGQHALYHRLRSAPAAGDLEVFEALVQRLATDADLRERAQLALGPLQDAHGYDLWWLAQPGAVAIKWWYVLFPVLAFTVVVLTVLAPFWPQLLPVAIAAMASSVVVRYLTDWQIGRMAAAFRQVAPVIRAGQSLRFLAADDLAPLLGSLRTDATPLGRLKTIGRWVSSDPFLLPIASGSLAMLINAVVLAVYEYLNLVLLLDANGVYLGGAALESHRDALLRFTAAIGEVDTAIAVASCRASRNDWSRPTFRPPGAPASWRDIRHPLIESVVPNTIALRAGQGAVITGSNMSGKTTFLRTVGVTTVMAQTLNTCLAAEYAAPRFVVRSCIGRADDLLSGRSYYLAEVEALLGLVQASAGGPPHLFLLDELFRGTNAVERIAAGEAVLRELTVTAGGSKPHAVLAATHDVELVDLLSDRYLAHHFGDEVGVDGLVFDHRLRPGRATTRNAIALLRLYGAPEGLIKRALTNAASLDHQRGSTTISR